MRGRLAVALLALAGCQKQGADATRPPLPRGLPGLHNLLRVSDRLLSGSSPEGDAGFASLRGLGVRTVLSVDGATPDVGRARRHGLRYVHLPVGYDGVPADQGRRIARAVRDLPGPVYLHCHHGRHRGPAAAAVALLCLDPSRPADAGLELLRAAGTDPRYVGLFRSVAELARPGPGELDAVPADFPETAERPDLMKLMVEVDATWDRLKAGPAAADATLLVEYYREAARLPGHADRPDDYRRLLTDAGAAAGDLEAALRAGDRPAAAAAAARSGKLCGDCHARHRDAPGR